MHQLTAVQQAAVPMFLLVSVLQELVLLGLLTHWLHVLLLAGGQALQVHLQPPQLLLLLLWLPLVLLLWCTQAPQECCPTQVLQSLQH